MEHSVKKKWDYTYMTMNIFIIKRHRDRQTDPVTKGR